MDRGGHDDFLHIDSHQHFWIRSRGDYTWLTPDLEPVYADFMPDQLRHILIRNGIAKTVLVQAAETDAETDFMLSIANNTEFVAAVVGWVNLEADNVTERLQELSVRPKFRGIRPMLQSIDRVDWMLSPEFDTVYRFLIDLDLSFDALITPVHLPSLCILARRYPKLRIVIDHAAKPDLTQSDLEAWRSHIAAIAKLPNVYCKLSGLLNETGKEACFSRTIPAIDHVLECFGPKRVMWGSDWPIIRLAGNYDQWRQDCRSYLSDLSPAEQEWIWGLTAQLFYRI